MNDEPGELIKLGPRLKMIADFVPQDAKVGDIGTDHAYLPVYLIQQGIIHKAIGVDIHQGPYQSALDTVGLYDMTNRIDIRLGNGVEPIERGEIDTLTIAGMGGNTILEILDTKPEVMAEVSTLILQPQGAEAKVRTILLQNGWKLQEECLVEEDDRIYTVLCFNREAGLERVEIEERIRIMIESFIDNLLCEEDRRLMRNTVLKQLITPVASKYIWQFGPIISESREHLLQTVIRERINHLENRTLEMAKADRQEVREQAQTIACEIKVLEGLEKWLFP